MATHQDQILVDDIKNHMELEYQGQLSDNSTTQKDYYCPKVEFQELVYVPGVCTGGGHLTGDASCHCGEPGYNCTSADEGFYVWTTVFMPMDCGGGGASPGGGIGPGSSPISTGPYNPIGGCGGLFAQPCQKLKKTYTKNAGIKTAVVNLGTKVSDSIEQGFTVDNSITSTTANPIQPLSAGSFGTIEIPSQPTHPYIVIAHTHNSPATKTYSVPSWEDLDELSGAIQHNPNFADVTNLIFITITADGTQYAIMIDNFQAFIDYFYWATTDPSQFNLTLFNKKDDNRLLYYYGKKVNNVEIPPKIKENSTDKAQDLKYFMQIAESAGLNVFEMDSTFGTFKEITVINNQIIKTECK
jgi:hypothetical protein